jgi:hypothetical protein
MPMKKLLMAVFVLCAAQAHAEQAGKTGVGLILGSPTGITAKHWTSERWAFDGGIGFGNAAVFYADALFNQWQSLKDADAKLNVYAGGGPRVATDDGGQFSLRVMVGLGFWPSKVPVELFAEIGPALKLAPDNRVGIDGGLGVRYYFDPVK